MVAGVGFEPHDLRVMSPTSYQTALPRGNVVLPTMWLFYQSLIIISDFGADVKCFEGVFRDIFSARASGRKMGPETGAFSLPPSGLLPRTRTAEVFGPLLFSLLSPVFVV